MSSMPSVPLMTLELIIGVSPLYPVMVARLFTDAASRSPCCEPFFCPPKTSFYLKFPENFPRKNVYTCRRGTVPCPPTGAYPHPFFVIPATIPLCHPRYTLTLSSPPPPNLSSPRRRGSPFKKGRSLLLRGTNSPEAIYSG